MTKITPVSLQSPAFPPRMSADRPTERVPLMCHQQYLECRAGTYRHISRHLRENATLHSENADTLATLVYG